MSRLLAAPLLLLAACSSGGKKPAGKDTARAAPDAAQRDAAMTWRGPNLYTLVDGDVTVAVVLRPPGTWEEDATDAHERLTSAAGSTMVVTLVKGAAAATQVIGDRHLVYERDVTFPAGPWHVRCELDVRDADGAIYSELAPQCDHLEVQQEPDPRIAWTIEVSPATVALADQARVTIRYTATNRGADPIDAKAYSLEYWIDGAPSMSLGMGFGNGGFDGTWTALPHGETVDDSREGFTDLATAAGDHVVSLVHLGREVARATLHVQ